MFQTRRRIFLVAAAPGEMLPKFPEPSHVFGASDSTVRIDKKAFQSNIEWTRHAPLRCVTTKEALYDLQVCPLTLLEKDPTFAFITFGKIQQGFFFVSSKETTLE